MIGEMERLKMRQSISRHRAVRLLSSLTSSLTHNIVTLLDRASAMTAATYLIIISSYVCLVTAQEIGIIESVIAQTMNQLCFTPCENGYTGNEVIPGTKCQWYHHCSAGEPTNIVECGDGLWYDPVNDYCDVSVRGQPVPSNCPPDPSCDVPAPTSLPTILSAPLPPEENPTEKPTRKPTEIPTMNQTPNFPGPPLPSQTSIPTGNSPNNPNETSTDYIWEGPIQTAPARPAMYYIESKKDLIEQLVLISYNRASGLSYPSTQYTFNGLIQSLQVMAIDGFNADFKFNLWEGVDEKWVHGLVNLASFLANAIVESIEDDTCDELNWQKFEGKFASSNSCGMESRSYQDENCVKGTTEFLSCDVDKSMQVTAVSRGGQARSPPPFKCKQGSGEANFAGYWDTSSGSEVANAPYANAAGRTDIEGCCWWGRGALSTKGICNIGKINYYLGKRGAELGRSTLYPELDFCRFPEVTCTSANGEQLRWTTAFFEWSERVQRYEENGWNFEDQLAQFVKDDMTTDSFILGVSRILSRGCHETGCSDIGEVRMLNKRRTYFFMIVNDVFDLKSLIVETLKPTPKPTRLFTRPPTLMPTKPPIVSIITSPPVDFSVGIPTPQPTKVRQITPNPTETQNINPSPVVPIALPDQPQSTPVAPVSQPEQPQSTPVAPVSQPEQPQSTPSKVAQLEIPPSNNNDGNVEEETYLPTYYGDGERLIGLEGNVACRVSAKHLFQSIVLLLAQMYHIVI